MQLFKDQHKLLYRNKSNKKSYGRKKEREIRQLRYLKSNHLEYFANESKISEEIQLKIIEKGYHNAIFIPFPTINIQRKLISSNPSYIQFLQGVNKEVLIEFSEKIFNNVSNYFLIKSLYNTIPIDELPIESIKAFVNNVKSILFYPCLTEKFKNSQFYKKELMKEVL